MTESKPSADWRRWRGSLADSGALAEHGSEHADEVDQDEQPSEWGVVMHIGRLDWDEYRVDHIATHDVSPDEVWEVCCDPFHLAHREGQQRYRLYGQTSDGRFLFVVLEHLNGVTYKPITARDMTDGEKRSYRRLVR
jgi:uncharacterized DUF497 family protein